VSHSHRRQTKMKVLILLALIGASVTSTIKDEVLEATYEDALAEGGKVKMAIHINKAEETIRFHMAEEGNMADVETLEDYESGFAASRVKDEESCFIRVLQDTLDQASAKAHEVAAAHLNRRLEDVSAAAIPAENAIEWAGERLMDFCGNYEVYKLVQSTDEEEEDEESDLETMGARQSVVTFRRCWFFLFFFKCITTTITVPTGTIFFFFG